MRFTTRMTTPLFVGYLVILTMTALNNEGMLMFAEAGALRKTTHSDSVISEIMAYPRVYTAVIPAPAAEELSPPNNNEGTRQFRAEVDFLKVVEHGVATPDKSKEYIRIAFLVHTKEELLYLHTLPDAAQIAMDRKATLELHDEADYDDDNDPKYDGARDRRLQEFSTISGFSCYRNLQGTFDFMAKLRNRAASIPNLEITLKDIGDSHLKTKNSNEGHDIVALKLTGNGAAAAKKGIMFVMTGLHAREYAPPELVARWLEMLVSKYGNDADITSILDHAEIHVVLQANPDGRQVAETSRRDYRRKNLNPIGGSSIVCGNSAVGVDLNRNFPFRWGRNNGSSGSGCSETYRGPSPGSEPEVRAIVDYCKSIFPADQRKNDPEGQIDGAPFSEDSNGIFLDIHSYGEIIIWPWGHKNQETLNNEGFNTLVNKFKYYNNYDYAGPKNGFSYSASGATDDWAYGVLGAAGMTFELGTSFYQNCGYFESSILTQNIPALTYAAKVSQSPYKTPKGPDVMGVSVSTAADGKSITVRAFASDSARSAATDSVPTSQQFVTGIVAYIDTHPYDGDGNSRPSGTPLSGDALGSGVTGSATGTIDISSLEGGRHVLYVEATDSDGYKGPVTAVYFTKEGDSDNVSSNPDGNNSTGAATGDNNVCADSYGTFSVGIPNETKDCDWLSINMRRFDHLCKFVKVAAACPLTCQQCALFGKTS